MARPRKPTKVLEISGAFERNPQRKVGRENEPEPTGPLGSPPPGLNEAEAARWEEIGRWCPWLGESDRPLVEATCRLWMQERDKTISPPDRKLFVQCLRALGMAPGERSRMVTRGTKDKPKLAKFA